MIWLAKSCVREGARRRIGADGVCAGRWFVDVPADVARERLAARHVQAGIEKTLELALLRADENDVPNGAHIRSNLIEPTIQILN